MIEDFHIDVYSSFSVELEKIWTKLEDKNGWSPFNSFAWLSHWQLTVGAPVGIKPQIIVIEQQDRPVALLPLAICKRKGVKILEWLGGIHADYMGPIVCGNVFDKKENFNRLWSDIHSKLFHFDVIHLRRQPAYLGPIENPFVSFLPAHHSDSSFQAALSDTWTDFYQKRIKKKLQADSKRQRIRISELGDLHFTVASTKDEMIAIIEKMIVYKRRRYEMMRVRDLLSAQAHREFYIKLVDALEKTSIKLHCSALTVDKEIIAAHVGVILNQRFYYLMPANDTDKWNRFSAGRLLLENLIEWSYESKLDIFDFTIGDEEYKKIWCDSELPLYEYIQPANLIGWLYYSSFKMIQKANKIHTLKSFYKLIRSRVQGISGNYK